MKVEYEYGVYSPRSMDNQATERRSGFGGPKSALMVGSIPRSSPADNRNFARPSPDRVKSSDQANALRGGLLFPIEPSLRAPRHTP